MNDYYNDRAYTYDAPINGVNRYVAKVFAWMFLGLMLTAMSTFAIVVGIELSPDFAYFIQMLSQGIFIVFIAQVFLVGFISVRIQKMHTSTAVLLYLIYAIVNGFTIGLFALIYAGSAVIPAFAITALSFGIMAVYGLTTDQDLTRVGNLLRMGLIGVILLSVVNIFIGSGPLDFLICIVGLFVFLGLTAYDTKKIKTHYAQAAMQDERLGNNLAIHGALMLYLDFINIFMFILRLMTGSRR